MPKYEIKFSRTMEVTVTIIAANLDTAIEKAEEVDAEQIYMSNNPHPAEWHQDSIKKV